MKLKKGEVKNTKIIIEIVEGPSGFGKVFYVYFLKFRQIGNFWSMIVNPKHI